MTGLELTLGLVWLVATVQWRFGKRGWLSVGLAAAAGVAWVLLWVVDGPRWAMLLVQLGIVVHWVAVLTHLLRHGLEEEARPRQEGWVSVVLPVFTGLGLLLALGAAALIPAPIRHLPATATQTFVPIQGHKMRLIAEGTGPTVILAPGGGITDPYREQAELFSRLKDKATVATYERPGYGLSEPTRVPRDAANVVAEMHELFHRAGLKPPFVLVGGSLASLEVLLYAQAHPDLVAAVVLLDGAPPSFYKTFALATASQDFDLETKVFQFLTGVTDTEWEGSFLWPNAQAILAGPKLTVPLTYFVAGKDEKWLEAQKEFSRLDDQAQAVFLPDASHRLYHEAPDRVADAILEKLRSP